MARHRHRNQAFTLIELLVVISIVAILMAILMPSLGRARKQAQFVRCKSNLKSYGLMAFLYTHDNDDKMPNAWTRPSTAWIPGATVPPTARASPP